MAAISISDDTVATYDEDGVALLRGVFSTDWIALLQDGVERAMADPGPLSKNYAEPDKGKFFTDHHMHQRNDAFAKFMKESPVLEIAARILKAGRLNYVDEHLLVKEPGTANPTYWHQDQPYFEVTGDQFASFWIPLDPVTADTGAMKFVKGSHRWGKMYQPIRIGLGDIVEQSDELDGHAPDIDAEPDRHDVLMFEMEPGDCLCFHGVVLHGANPNLSHDVRRRALSLRFAGDDITWQPRSYIPSRPETADLVAGGPLGGDQYPELWTA